MPLQVRVVERGSGIAVAYAGRLLGMSGADVFGLAVSAVVLVYLIYALVRGERL